MLSMIWAQSKNGVIGNHGQIPWKQKADMRHFVTETIHRTILAGYKTFKSFGRPLPNRRNVVLTRRHFNDLPSNVLGLKTIKDCRDFIRQNIDEDIVVVGGASIYRILLPYVQYLYRTDIDADVHGDTKFPNVLYQRFNCVAQTKWYPADKNNQYPYRFDLFERKNIL